MHDPETARGTVFTWDTICWVSGQMVDYVSVAVLRCNFIGFFLHHVKKKIHSIEKYTSFILKNGQPYPSQWTEGVASGI